MQTARMHIVYVLHSAKDHQLYMGYTANLKRRLLAHTNGEVRSTKPRRPLTLIFYEAFRSKGDALRRERYFKTNEGKKMLRRIIRHTLREITDE